MLRPRPDPSGARSTDSSLARNAANFATFQAGWFACAISAGMGHPMLGPAVVGMLIGGHVFFCRSRWEELKLLGVVFVLGGFIDSLQWVLGLSIGPIEAMPRAVVPFWFATLYANFATTLRFSLSWLGKRPWLAALLGATGGPITYRGGASFGALTLEEPEWQSLLILAVVWGLLTPALFVIEKRLRGGPETARPAASP